LTKQEILNEVIAVISKINRKPNADAQQITEETKIQSLGLNSLSYIRMVVLIENKFNVKIYDAMTESNDKDSLTVGGLCDCITDLLKI
jgi:acyl carrier protein